MQVRIYGSRHDKLLSRLMRDFAGFIVEKFCGPAPDIKITIRMSVVEADFLAVAVNMEAHLRNPKAFSISIQPGQSVLRTLRCLAHELVHVKQWYLGEFYDDFRNDVAYFLGKPVDLDPDDDLEYWDLPWEIEANGREVGLVRQWVARRGFEAEEWYAQGNF